MMLEAEIVSTLSQRLLRIVDVTVVLQNLIERVFTSAKNQPLASALDLVVWLTPTLELYYSVHYYQSCVGLNFKVLH